MTTKSDIERLTALLYRACKRAGRLHNVTDRPFERLLADGNRRLGAWRLELACWVLQGEVAGGDMTGAEGPQRGFFGGAQLLGQRAPGTEPAP